MYIHFCEYLEIINIPYTNHQANGYFDIYWDSRKNNLANYHTKHHSLTHHQNVRQNYVLQNFLINNYKSQCNTFFFKYIYYPLQFRVFPSNCDTRVC